MCVSHNILISTSVFVFLGPTGSSLYFSSWLLNSSPCSTALARWAALQLLYFINPDIFVPVARSGLTRLLKRLEERGSQSWKSHWLWFCKILTRYCPFVRVMDDGNCMESGTEPAQIKVKPINVGSECKAEPENWWEKKKWGGVIDRGKAEEGKEEEQTRPRTCQHCRSMSNCGEMRFCLGQRVESNLMDFSAYTANAINAPTRSQPF